MAEGGKDGMTPEEKLRMAQENAEQQLAQGRQQGRINNEVYKDAMDLFDVETMEKFRDAVAQKWGGGPTIDSIRQDIAGMLLQNQELWGRLVGRTSFTRSEIEEVEEKLLSYYYTTHFSSSG